MDSLKKRPLGRVRSFVLFQPGCDLMADDILVFDDSYAETIKYIVDRGGDPRFFTSASFGDVMPFDRERVVFCVGKVWGK
jgi:hypothetical protein